MEPEAHRLDREAMLADHLSIAERVGREVDEAVAAAAEKRAAYLDWFVNQMSVDARLQVERDRLLAGGQPLPAADREPAGQGAGRSQWWEDVDAERAPVAWAIGS